MDYLFTIWPQIGMILMYGTGFGTAAAKHGTTLPRVYFDKYIVSLALAVFFLIAGGFFANMGKGNIIPQMVYMFLAGASAVITWKNNGKYPNTKYNILTSLIGILISSAILYYGHFWDKLI